MPEIYVFGGCNGSGKTTLATRVLSTVNNEVQFVNADIIAAELNPNDVDSAAIQASRIMLQRLQHLAQENLDFAFETTLAARTFAKFLRSCKAEGYTINLIYIWLNSPELALSRVAKRVASGGHNIPQDIIVRRYERGRRNFVELYIAIADRWIVYNNSQQRQKVAEKPL
nr:zeta toxin family protein [Xenococcaceae cyanobacterium MO_188.B19]